MAFVWPTWLIYSRQSHLKWTIEQKGRKRGPSKRQRLCVHDELTEFVDAISRLISSAFWVAVEWISCWFVSFQSWKSNGFFSTFHLLISFKSNGIYQHKNISGADYLSNHSYQRKQSTEKISCCRICGLLVSRTWGLFFFSSQYLQQACLSECLKRLLRGTINKPHAKKPMTATKFRDGYLYQAINTAATAHSSPANLG